MLMQRAIAFLLLLIPFIAVGCDRDSNNDLRSTQNEQPSPNVVIKTTTLGFGHISEGPEDLYGPFTFETEGTFVGVPSWTFSGELLDARLQPVPGVGNTIGILVGAPVTVGTFFITATVLDTGNGATHTVTVPFTVVDCTPGVLGNSILDLTATVSGSADEGVPFLVPLELTGSLSPLITWRAISPNPNISFSFIGANPSTTLIMEGHSALDSPVSVVVTAIDNGPDINSVDSDGFFEQNIGSGSGCSVSMTLQIGVTGGSGPTTPPGGEDCTNGIDDDGDGLIDSADPDCGGLALAFTTGAISVPVGDDASATPTVPEVDTSTLTVAPGGALPITDLIVRVDISHTFSGDIGIALSSPGGTTGSLVDSFSGTAVVGDPITSADVYSPSIFDDSASSSVSITTGSPGTFIPVDPISTIFDGEDASGTWTLTVSDYYPADVGTINEWALAFNGASLP